MKRITFIIYIISLFAFQVVHAQENHKDRWQRIRTEKISFLTDKLDLTPSEAQKFWPVYNELEDKRWEAQKTRHNLEVKVQESVDSLSDKEIIQLTREYAGNMQKEAALMVQYNEKFLKILPPKKVLKLYKAENDFRMYMFKKYRDRHRNDEGSK